MLTGHANGLITINIAEADDVERERMRVQMNEQQRTLLGQRTTRSVACLTPNQKLRVVVRAVPMPDELAKQLDSRADELRRASAAARAGSDEARGSGGGALAEGRTRLRELFSEHGELWTHLFDRAM